MMFTKLKVYIRTLQRTRINLVALQNGQANNYAILQMAHRLEKGLCIRNPRSLWGWDKANALFGLIQKELNSKSADIFAIKVGASVLKAYIDSKKELGDCDDRKRVEEFTARLAKIHDYISDQYGGTLVASVCQNQDNLFDSVVKSRHSTRNFNDSAIDDVNLREAIESALLCPNACNRQPYHIYVVDAKKKTEYLGSTNEFNANKYIIITGVIDAFSISEMNDWIVSASIFAGYLTLCLHNRKIGSCIMRKDLLVETDYNKKIRALCSIPETEQIVLEMAIGNYNYNALVPVSKRKTIDEICKFVL